MSPLHDFGARVNSSGACKAVVEVATGRPGQAVLRQPDRLQRQRRLSYHIRVDLCPDLDWWRSRRLKIRAQTMQ